MKIMAGDHDDDPKTLQAKVTAANNLGHQALAQLSKLDSRFKDKQEITHNGPVVFGWIDDNTNKEDDLDKIVSDVELDAMTGDSVPN